MVGEFGKMLLYLCSLYIFFLDIASQYRKLLLLLFLLLLLLLLAALFASFLLIRRKIRIE